MSRNKVWHFIWLHILIKFKYITLFWWQYKSQKSLFLHIFARHLKWFSALKDWRWKEWKRSLCNKLFHVIRQIFFYWKIMWSFFSFIWNHEDNYFFFMGWVMFWNISRVYFFFINIQTIKNNYRIIVLKSFPVIDFWRIIYSFPVIFIYKRLKTLSGCYSISP